MAGYNDHFKKISKNKKKLNVTSLHYQSNKPRKRNSSMGSVGLAALLCFTSALYGFVYPEQLISFVSNIQIGFLSQSLANEADPNAPTAAANSAEESSAKEEKKSPSSALPATAGLPSSAPKVSEKQNYVQYLEEKEKSLGEREKRVADLEEKLQQEKLELEKKIQQLEQTRRDIASRLETRVAQDQESIDKLVGMYSNMKPQNAAQIISKLDEELAISVLKKMKKQEAGGILNFMDPQKAKVLSEKYSGY